MKTIDIQALFEDSKGHKCYFLKDFHYEHAWAVQDTDSGAFFGTEAGIDHCVSQLLFARDLKLCDLDLTVFDWNNKPKEKQPGISTRLAQCAEAYAALGVMDKAIMTVLHSPYPTAIDDIQTPEQHAAFERALEMSDKANFRELEIVDTVLIVNCHRPVIKLSGNESVKESTPA